MPRKIVTLYTRTVLDPDAKGHRREDFNSIFPLNIEQQADGRWVMGVASNDDMTTGDTFDTLTEALHEAGRKLVADHPRGWFSDRQNLGTDRVLARRQV